MHHLFFLTFFIKCMILAYFFDIILATKFVFSDLVYIDLSFYKYYIFWRKIRCSLCWTNTYSWCFIKKKRRRKKIDRNLKISIKYVFFVYVLLLKRNICNLYYFLSHNPCWFLTCYLSLFSINYRLCVKMSISFKWTFMSVDFFCSFLSFALKQSYGINFLFLKVSI